MHITRNWRDHFATVTAATIAVTAMASIVHAQRTTSSLPIAADNSIAKPALANVCVTTDGLQGGYWHCTNGVPASDLATRAPSSRGSSAPIANTSTVALIASLGEPVLSHPVLADVNGDGTDEIVLTSVDPTFGQYGRIHVLTLQGVELPGWPVTLTGFPLTSTPAVGDLEGDGSVEIVVETHADFANSINTERVWVFDASGVVRAGFPVILPGEPVGAFTNGPTPSPSLVDINNDGRREILSVAMGFSGSGDPPRVVAFSASGSIVFDRPLPRADPAPRLEWVNSGLAPAVGDMLGDSSLEIELGVFRKNASDQFGSTRHFLLHHDGTIASGWPRELGGARGQSVPKNFAAITPANSLGDRVFLTAVADEPNGIDTTVNLRMHAMTSSGSELAGFPISLSPASNISSYVGSALADLDRDGVPEIVAVTTNQLSGVLTSHNVASSQRVELPISERIDWYGAVSLARNAADVTCAFFTNFRPYGLYDPEIAGVCLDGEDVPGFPVELACEGCDAGNPGSSVALTLEQASKTLSAIVVDPNQGNVYKIAVAGLWNDVPWGQFQQNARRTGHNPAFVDSVLRSGERIRAKHIEELRTRVDALRIRFGLPAFNWTDPAPMSGEDIKVVHITELRTALSAVYGAANRTVPAFTDALLASGVTAIRAVHITELRTFVVAIE